MKKIAFIINPLSGGKDKRKIPGKIAQLFPASEGYVTEIVHTQRAGDATQLAEKLVAQGFKKIVAVGGDGTINEVARVLVHTDVAMGIVPYGSGNGLARYLKISLIPGRALSLLKSASVQAIDYCTINGVAFFCTAGIGFDALIGNRFAQDKERGPLTYVKHIFLELVNYKPEKYRLTLDGKVIERDAFLVTFANASQWGNNAHIAPSADIADGLMDVVVISKFAFYQIPQLGIKLFTKQLNSEQYVEVFQCKHAIVEREDEGYAHFDGEPSTMGAKLEVKVFPKALKVLTK